MKREPITTEEIYDIVRYIKDPEHPMTLEELNVVIPSYITIDEVHNHVVIYYKLTVPDCPSGAIIGLAIKIALSRSLPIRYSTEVLCLPGSHHSEFVLNKQVNDKERVSAALENPKILTVINQALP
ncbi:MIP18 family like protein [Aduncisulcus paluster]|uniref:MIP18 family like protein n=1 Tax=Aduncisulcus paluster TaxID=2918883 RepID=A0ABQ5JW64_9EUKA|nr:MIP18 family like protein [Aduncisulcus paluster]|eukprot:gnl/Carplike_NY0171/3255_a4382_518.p1 GENE.gnl/Carplike_NY0171/3255_a4382_518~~gnl/Carplike_NY0171/3255_a4382_518.p1  ORF type:complete len:126 (-),score=12.23 gnl/Carplike_NY0171/3255_a4382_518:162-539(-)